MTQLLSAYVNMRYYQALPQLHHPIIREGFIACYLAMINYYCNLFTTSQQHTISTAEYRITTTIFVAFKNLQDLKHQCSILSNAQIMRSIERCDISVKNFIVTTSFTSHNYPMIQSKLDEIIKSHSLL